MIQLGILLMLFGFGSLILLNFDMEFKLLTWAYDMQPAFGIIVGIIGLALLIGGIVMKQQKDKKATTGQWSGAQPTFGQPQNPGQPQGYAQQPQQGFGQPQGYGQPQHPQTGPTQRPVPSPGFGQQPPAQNG